MNNSVINATYGSVLMNKFQEFLHVGNHASVHIEAVTITKESYTNLKKQLKLDKAFITEHGDLLSSKALTKSQRTEVIVDMKAFIQLNVSYNNDREVQYYLSRFYGTEEYWNTLVDLIEAPAQNLKPKVHWITGFRSDGSPVITDLTITPPKSFNPYAYPSLKEDLQAFIKDYINSSSSILLLHSVPGMGKTTFLKFLLDAINASCLLTYSQQLKSSDDLFTHFLTCEQNFLIMEDADTYLASRELDGNTDMKKLLNITDGLTSNPDKKLIVTTNITDMSKVDSAFLRAGRCYRVLGFTPLTPEQADKFFEYEGKTPNLYIQALDEGKTKFTVAELYSYLNGYEPDDIVVKSSTQFGFGRSHG